jgi:hypothetical protein
MNPISNIWEHPRTSAAGLLIAVVTIAGVLSQQGLTLGKAGAGSVVSLISALATALLGLLARDPQTTPPSAGSTAKLGAWAMIALLVPLPWLQGCTGKGMAQDIVNWTPSLQSAVATVDSTAALLAPADAPIFAAATSGFDAASNLLVAQANAYLANPSATILSLLQSQIVAFQKQVNASLLAAAKITNQASQQQALTAIQAVATIVTTILSLVESISSKAQVARMAAAPGVKLAEVQRYLNAAQAAQIVAAHYDEPVSLARAQIAQAEQAEIQAGL